MMKTEKILKEFKDKLSQIADAIIPRPAPQLAPIPVRAQKPRRR